MNHTYLTTIPYNLRKTKLILEVFEMRPPFAIPRPLKANGPARRNDKPTARKEVAEHPQAKFPLESELRNEFAPPLNVYAMPSAPSSAGQGSHEDRPDSRTDFSVGVSLALL